MSCECDKIPDNAIMHPTAFATKSLGTAKWYYSNIECDILQILHGLEVSPLLFLQGVMHHHSP